MGVPKEHPFFIIGFSQLKASEFFVFRKMEMLLTENHPFYGCASDVIQKSHLSLLNKPIVFTEKP